MVEYTNHNDERFEYERIYTSKGAITNPLFITVNIAKLEGIDMNLALTHFKEAYKYAMYWQDKHNSKVLRIIDLQENLGYFIDTATKYFSWADTPICEEACLYTCLPQTMTTLCYYSRNGAVIVAPQLKYWEMSDYIDEFETSIPESLKSAYKERVPKTPRTGDFVTTLK
jgi:hypothetical protein